MVLYAGCLITETPLTQTRLVDLVKTVTKAVPSVLVQLLRAANILKQTPNPIYLFIVDIVTLLVRLKQLVIPPGLAAILNMTPAAPADPLSALDPT